MEVDYDSSNLILFRARMKSSIAKLWNIFVFDVNFHQLLQLRLCFATTICVLLYLE